MRDFDSLIDKDKWNLKSNFSIKSLRILSYIYSLKKKKLDYTNYELIKQNLNITFIEFCDALQRLDEYEIYIKRSIKNTNKRDRYLCSMRRRNPYQIIHYYNICQRMKKSEEPYQDFYDALSLLCFRIITELSFSDLKFPIKNSMIKDNYKLDKKQIFFKSPQSMIEYLLNSLVPDSDKLYRIQTQYTSTKGVPHSQKVIRTILDKGNLCHINIDEQKEIYKIWYNENKYKSITTLKSITKKML